MLLWKWLCRKARNSKTSASIAHCCREQSPQKGILIPAPKTKIKIFSSRLDPNASYTPLQQASVLIKLTQKPEVLDFRGEETLDPARQLDHKAFFWGWGGDTGCFGENCCLSSHRSVATTTHHKKHNTPFLPSTCIHQPRRFCHLALPHRVGHTSQMPTGWGKPAGPGRERKARACVPASSSQASLKISILEGRTAALPKGKDTSACLFPPG